VPEPGAGARLRVQLGLLFTRHIGRTLPAGGSALTWVRARVCAHRGGAQPRATPRAEEKCSRDHVETEMTCRCVDTINNIPPFSLFKKRTKWRPVNDFCYKLAL